MNVRSALSPARFRSMYDMMMCLKVDALLIQESNISEELAANYEDQFPQILITTNSEGDNANRGVSIIINSRTTAWAESEIDGSHTALATDDNRLLICNVIYKRQPVTIGVAYGPAANNARIPWYTLTTGIVRQNLARPCDIVGGGGGENRRALKFKKKTQKPPPPRPK